MDLDERLTRLEDAYAYLVVVLSDGQRGWYADHLDSEVVEAGLRMEAFVRTVVNERAF